MSEELPLRLGDRQPSVVKLTPMLQQYLRLKEHHPDAILLYRLGDFYEMFFEDAEAGARLLQITLTSRQGMPMAGISCPHRFVSSAMNLMKSAAGR